MSMITSVSTLANRQSAPRSSGMIAWFGTPAKASKLSVENEGLASAQLEAVRYPPVSAPAAVKFALTDVMSAGSPN